ncbi:(d)CMP kinase, partial [Nocardia sp. NPDC058497]|uniref:(d)CMP kinase n=1 Tax=Nocardia sp. NPDC058497 TaxID=3346529 RepID=UPI003663CFE2
ARLRGVCGAVAGGMVVGGRDIGPVGHTGAAPNISRPPTAAARAQRRNAQNIREGRGDDYQAVLADVQRRDTLDSTRTVSPLRPAADAVLVDTSDLTMDETIDELYRVVAQQLSATTGGSR